MEFLESTGFLARVFVLLVETDQRGPLRLEAGKEHKFLPIYYESKENSKFLFAGIFMAFHEHIVNVYIRWHHAFTNFHDIGAPARKFTALPQVLFMF
jgi:hypothetical protein